MGKYTVISYDNGCFGEGGAPISRGEYDLAVEAISRASLLVDMALAEHFANATDVADLMTFYSVYGSEVPYIHGEPAVGFDPYAYAEQRASLLFATKGTP